MRPEYDLSDAIRGEYHEVLHASSNVVILTGRRGPFGNTKAVNEALRAILRIADQAKV